MKLIEFISEFPDEQSCREKFKIFRDKVGVICPKCGCRYHYWCGGSVQRYKCKMCGYKQSLKANTVMHHSKLSFKEWFICMHLLTSTKSSFSAAEIQRQLGKKYYRPIWQMCCKIRECMSKAENDIILSGELELDEAFFAYKATEKPTKTKKQSRDHLAKVIVCCESEDYSYKQSLEQSRKYKSVKRKFGRMRMFITDSLTDDSITFKLLPHIDKNSVVYGDGTKAHNLLKQYISAVHSEVLQAQEDILRVLPHVHLNIGHSKNQFSDIHHGVSKQYLQIYLDGFTYKKNRRYEPDLFLCLLADCAKYKNTWHDKSFWDKPFDIQSVIKSLKI